jgi:hypothetical protein
MRVSMRTYRILKDLSQSSGATMQDLLDQAIEDFRRRRFLEAANESYAALRQDPEAWRSFREELAEWEATLADGLPPEPEPAKPRRKRA